MAATPRARPGGAGRGAAGLGRPLSPGPELRSGAGFGPTRPGPVVLAVSARGSFRAGGSVPGSASGPGLTAPSVPGAGEAAAGGGDPGAGVRQPLRVPP